MATIHHGYLLQQRKDGLTDVHCQPLQAAHLAGRGKKLQQGAVEA